MENSYTSFIHDPVVKRKKEIFEPEAEVQCDIQSFNTN